MAAPTYTSDLTTINDCSSLTVPDTFAEPTGMTAGTTLALQTDFYIEGANCISKLTNQIGTSGAGFPDASGAITLPAGEAIWFWIYHIGAKALDTRANGGLQVIVGNTLAAYYAYYLEGSDTYVIGGWKRVPIDPTLTGNDADGFAFRNRTQGVPSGAWSAYGVGCVQLSAVAGAGMGIDYIAYGRDLLVEFGDSGTPATFSLIAANDATNTRGQFQLNNGAYYLQGLLILGSATNAIDFRDTAGGAVFIQKTPKVASGFNEIEIRNASSRIDLTAWAFTALGIQSRGKLTVTDNADLNIDSCSFTDMGTFAFLAASTIITSVFRRTDKITTGGATFNGCTIDSNRATTAMLCATPAQATLISNTKFISDGTGYAIEITGTVANITLVGNTYLGYAGTNGSTGNEAIFVNIASGIINISISGGDIPTIRTAGATVNIISSNTLTINGFLTGSDVVIYEAGTTNILDSVDASVPTSFIYSYSGADTIDIGVFKAGYIPLYVRNLSITTTDSTLPVSQVIDRAYLV